MPTMGFGEYTPTSGHPAYMRVPEYSHNWDWGSFDTRHIRRLNNRRHGTNNGATYIRLFHDNGAGGHVSAFRNSWWQVVSRHGQTLTLLMADPYRHSQWGPNVSFSGSTLQANMLADFNAVRNTLPVASQNMFVAGGGTGGGGANNAEIFLPQAGLSGFSWGMQTALHRSFTANPSIPGNMTHHGGVWDIQSVDLRGNEVLLPNGNMAWLNQADGNVSYGFLRPALQININSVLQGNSSLTRTITRTRTNPAFGVTLEHTVDHGPTSFAVGSFFGVMLGTNNDDFNVNNSTLPAGVQAATGWREGDPLGPGVNTAVIFSTTPTNLFVSYAWFLHISHVTRSNTVMGVTIPNGEVSLSATHTGHAIAVVLSIGFPLTIDSALLPTGVEFMGWAHSQAAADAGQVTPGWAVGGNSPQIMAPQTLFAVYQWTTGAARTIHIQMNMDTRVTGLPPAIRDNIRRPGTHILNQIPNANPTASEVILMGFATTAARASAGEIDFAVDHPFPINASSPTTTNLFAVWESASGGWNIGEWGTGPARTLTLVNGNVSRGITLTTTTHVILEGTINAVGINFPTPTLPSSLSGQFTFGGWAFSAQRANLGRVDIAVGSMFTMPNHAVTLHAVWVPVI